jgi:PKD repeat protein
MKKALLLSFSFLCVLIMHASIIHVPSDYSSIQEAFSAAVDGDTIVLAKGTYTENLSVSNKSVVITSQYMFSKNESDIDGTVWLSAAAPQTPNHTINVSGSRSYTLSLIGIVFKNNPTTALYFSGYNFIASHLKFFTNTGGALSIWDGDAIIKHSIFEGNSRNDNGGAVDIQLSNEDRTVVIDSCQFKSNTSPSNGGGLKGSVYKSSLTVSNSIFTSNTAYKGGAIAISPGTNAYVTIKNNVIVENRAQLEGGGIHMSGRGSRITNNTIVNNQLTQHGVNNKGAGIFLTGNNTFSYTYLSNNIIKFNATESTDKEVYASYQSGALYSKVYLAYCNLSDNTADYYSENSVVEFEFKEGNITENPLFVDIQNSNYSLQSESPCIDAGDPDTNANFENYKYDLEDRDSDGTRKDIGAIYYHQNVQPRIIALFDYSVLGYYAPLVVEFKESSDWIATTPPTNWAWDFDNDGIIDSYEQNPIHVYEEPGTYSVKLTVSNNETQDYLIKQQAIEVLSSQKEIENIDIRFAGQNYGMGDASWEDQGVLIRVAAEYETSSSIHDGGLWLHPAVATFDFTEMQGEIYSISLKVADWCPPSGCTTIRFYANNEVVQSYFTNTTSIDHIIVNRSEPGMSIDSMTVLSFEGVVRYVKIQKEKIEDPCKIQSQLSIETIDCNNFLVSSTISNDQKPYTVEWLLNDEVYSNEESFEVELLEAGVYTFKLVVTDELDNTCVKIREQSVTIVEQPTISIFPTVDKVNKQVSLKGVVEGITDYTYSWDLGDNSPVNTTDLDRLVHDYNTNGEYTITLTVTPNNSQNCSYQQEVTVSLDNCYLEGELYIYQIACNQFSIGSNVQNNNQSYTAQWYVNDVMFSDNEISPIILPVGKHMIRLELTDQNLQSCTLTLTEEIHVYNPVITINTIVNPLSKQLSFNAVVEGIDEFDFYWYFGDSGNGSGDDTALSGMYTYPSAGTYDIAFSVLPKGSMGGCSYHKNVQVVIPAVQQNDPCDKAIIKGKLNADIAILIANAVQVDAYKKNNNDKYELLKSASISQSGDFEFLDLAQGEYLLVGRIINPEQYPLVIASYFNQMMEQVFSWQEASPIQLVCNATAHVELSMITLEDLLTGEASVSGYVYYEGGTRNLVVSALKGKRGLVNPLDRPACVFVRHE